MIPIWTVGYWYTYKIITAWWFGTFSIFHNIWDNPSQLTNMFQIVKIHQPVAFVNGDEDPFTSYFDVNRRATVLTHHFPRTFHPVFCNKWKQTITSKRFCFVDYQRLTMLQVCASVFWWTCKPWINNPLGCLIWCRPYLGSSHTGSYRFDRQVWHAFLGIRHNNNPSTNHNQA